MAAGIRSIRMALLRGTGCGSCFGTPQPIREKTSRMTQKGSGELSEREKSNHEAARRLLDNFEW